MRILVAHNNYRSAQPSGENVVVEDEARLLAEFGHEVQRLTVASDDIARWPLRKKATLPLRVVWSREGYRLTSDAISRFRPDVIHFHNTFPLLSPAALWAARRSGTPVVQTLHNFRPLCPAATFFRDGRISEDCLGRYPWPAVRHGCYRGSRAATLPIAAMDAVHARARTWTRCVDTFIVPSAFTGQKYVEAGWPADRISVKFNTAPDQASRRVGAGAGFVCLSRLGPEKGLDVLLRAWAEAFPNGEERLTVIGSGEAERSLRAAARGSPAVEFRGRLHREVAARVVALARAVVVPSRSYEVFPRTVVEAYALGVPVIASRLGALAEVVEEERTGLLFAPSSTSDLAAALQRLASSDELSEHLGRGARAVYEEKYSPTRTTERLIAIYERTRRNGGAEAGAR